VSERACEDGTPAAYEPREQTPHWHLKRAHALLFKAGLSDPVLMEACALIDDASRLINGKDEPQPIRRGDVVQVRCNRLVRNEQGFATSLRIGEAYVVAGDGDAEANQPPLLWVDGRKYECNWRSLVRIGRARYYPDGTPVED